MTEVNLNPTFAETLKHEQGRIFPSDMSASTLNNIAHHKNVITALEQADRYKWIPFSYDTFDKFGEEIEIVHIYTNIDDATEKMYAYYVGTISSDWLLPNSLQFFDLENNYICDADDIDYWRLHDSFSEAKMEAHA